MYANVSACVWHRKSVQLHKNVCFFLSWYVISTLICQSSVSHLQSEIYKWRWLYISVRVSQQSRMPLWSKESQAMKSVKPRYWFSSQIKQLAGLQFSCLHISLWCIGRIPGYMRHPHRTNRHDIRRMSLWRGARAGQGVSIGTRSHKEHLNDSLSSLFFLLVKSLWLLNMNCVTVLLYCPYPFYSSLIITIILISKVNCGFFITRNVSARRR